MSEDATPEGQELKIELDSKEVSILCEVLLDTITNPHVTDIWESDVVPILFELHEKFGGTSDEIAERITLIDKHKDCEIDSCVHEDDDDDDDGDPDNDGHGGPF